MPAHQFTVEQAREAGRKSAQLRAQRKLEPKPEPIIEPVVSQPTLSGYARELLCTRDELLAELRATPLAKDKAAIAQALKNVIESYHMETGKPKPGTIKPERQSSRQQVKQPSEPKLDTTGSGSAS